MAGFTFTDGEIAEVKLQMGKSLRFDALTTDEINSKTVRDAACDYVIETVTRGITEQTLADEVSGGVLTQAEADAFGKARDETETDVTNFINQALKPPQAQQFRRSIIYRSAGLGVAVVTQLYRETVGPIEQWWEEHKWEDRQVYLFGLCDDEIVRLRKAFPQDLFRIRPASITLFALA